MEGIGVRDLAQVFFQQVADERRSRIWVLQFGERGDGRIAHRAVVVFRDRPGGFPAIDVDVEQRRAAAPARLHRGANRQHLGIGCAGGRAHRAGHAIFGLLGFGQSRVDEQLARINGHRRRRKPIRQCRHGRRLRTKQIAPDGENFIGHGVAVADKPE
jgi:hypothetical protein